MNKDDPLFMAAICVASQFQEVQVLCLFVVFLTDNIFQSEQTQESYEDMRRNSDQKEPVMKDWRMVSI